MLSMNLSAATLNGSILYRVCVIPDGFDKICKVGFIVVDYTLYLQKVKGPEEPFSV